MKKYKWLFAVAVLSGLAYLGYRFYLLPILFPVDTEIRAYVQENLVPIRTIDPKDIDFADLAALEAAIGDASVVLLGEQDHGDAPTFLAKTRIIKFLHQRMGFDVLVFESDFYGLSRSWELVMTGQAKKNTYRHNVYSLWANCSECAEPFRYIDSNLGSDQELTVAGADPKPDLQFSSENLLAELDGLIEEKQLMEDREKKQRFLEILEETMMNQYNSKATTDQKDFFLTTVDEMSEKLEEGSFWHQELKSLQGFVLNAWDPLKSNNHRDSQMADNMMWLINEFKGRKIIFWGSNSHILKNYKEAAVYNKYSGVQDTTSMGTALHRSLKDDLYILGFTSHHGKAGRLYFEKYDLPKPNRRHFENWVHETGVPYAFVNFKGSPFVGDSTRQLFMKTLLHKSSLFNWFNLFDGIFYIEEMYPCSEEKYWWR
jgi:erythromycin esterase